MGVEFIEMEPNNRVVLEKWLVADTSVNDTSTRLLVGGLLLLVAAAVIALIALMIS